MKPYKPFIDSGLSSSSSPIRSRKGKQRGILHANVNANVNGRTSAAQRLTHSRSTPSLRMTGLAGNFRCLQDQSCSVRDRMRNCTGRLFDNASISTGFWSTERISGLIDAEHVTRKSLLTRFEPKVNTPKTQV